MMEIEMGGCLDEYEKLVFRMNTPRVVIDNSVCASATILKVDSGRRHSNLLESVQILTDLNLSIRKAYISSDGRWNMDVFHVTDINGSKLNDQSVLSYIEKSIETVYYGKHIECNGLTALELTGTDRVGILSEVFAVLSDLNCNVVDANVWTHNGRIASIIYVKDCNSGSPIHDPLQIARIESRLRNILKSDNGIKSEVRTCVSMEVTHTERRLHQLMFEDRDYEMEPGLGTKPEMSSVISVQNWAERSYSVITVECKDRTKLLFDVVCTLTDMEYVVFHATINTPSDRAYLEFYIRHKDGSPISSEPERQRVIQCLKAAVERRESKGVRLELRHPDRQGLVAEVTRTFRENGLNVTRAEISTDNRAAMNVFYVTDANGEAADSKLIESVREKIGFEWLRVKEMECVYNKKGEEEEQHTRAVLVTLGSLVWRHLFSFRLVR